MDALLHPPLERLGLDDLDEVARFLDTAWSEQYGAASYPVFTAEYLRWLYGGPHAGDNVLLGVRDDHGLAAYKALLYRPLLIRGTSHRSHVTTHLAVAPRLSLADRLGAIASLTELHSFSNRLGDHTLSAGGAMDTLVAFYDDDKGYQRTTEARYVKAGVKRAPVPFQHAIVQARKVAEQLKRDAASGVEVTAREARRDEVEGLAVMFRRVATRHDVALDVTPEWLAHHFFGYELSRIYVAELDGQIEGFVGCYALDTAHAGGVRRVIVLEYLIVEGDVRAATALADSALRFADEVGARGVVIENATYLDSETFARAGLLPSTRRMVGALGMRELAVAPTAMLLDVK